MNIVCRLGWSKWSLESGRGMAKKQLDETDVPEDIHKINLRLFIFYKILRDACSVLILCAFPSSVPHPIKIAHTLSSRTFHESEWKILSGIFIVSNEGSELKFTSTLLSIRSNVHSALNPCNYPFYVAFRIHKKRKNFTENF